MSVMAKWILNFTMLSLVSGCWVSGPENKLAFDDLNNVKRLQGVYTNKGETGTEKNKYLSQVLWGYEVFGEVPSATGQSINAWVERVESNHAKIDRIQVIALSDNEINVSAISDDCITYERKYIYSEDFTFIKGKIYIKREGFLLSRGAGDVLVGPSYQETVLGLDEAGDGKYQDSGYFAGLVFLLFPVAGGGIEDVKFAKKDSSFVRVKCKKLIEKEKLDVKR